MVYAEQNVGFWLAFTLPTILFCFCPMVMFLCRNEYKRSPPTGSVMGKAFKLWVLAAKGRWSLNPIKTYVPM
jgi:proton-dependent oligopeptide transporter, POT family